jgi:hypothetical protein
MRSRRLPRTSYGYLPPPDARAKGWHCAVCERGDHPAPRRWPHTCEECGTSVDPIMEDPWSHDAEGHRLRHALSNPDRADGGFAEAQYPIWRYKDAKLRGDEQEAASARRDFRRMIVEQGGPGPCFAHMLGMVWSAIEAGDLDLAGEELLGWHPTVDTDDLHLRSNSMKSTITRSFLNGCISFLECPQSIGHRLEPAIDEAMNDVARRAYDELTDQKAGMKRVRHLRAQTSESARITLESRTTTAVGPGAIPRYVRRSAIPRGRRLRGVEAAIASARSEGIPEKLASAATELLEMLSGPDLDDATRRRAGVALADAALAVDETHDDPDFLRNAADRLDQVDLSTLACLLRAQASMSEPDSAQAEAELREAAERVDSLTLALLPDIHALLARLVARPGSPDAIRAAIEECRAGRRRGLRPWRRATAADITLAHLLVWSEQPDAVNEAIRLSRRQCRPWHSGGARARLALNEAYCARDVLSFGTDTARRMAGWRKAATRSAHHSVADRARLATAWVAWAVDTDSAATAAEAYQYLVSIVPLEAATRYRSAARDKVLAAAQEHTEEAGYWLSRARRFRDAAVALETGRAVKLSEVVGLDRAGISEPALAEQFRIALDRLDAEERRVPGPHNPSHRLRDAWAEVRTAARRVAAATGVDPLAPRIEYTDIIASTGDGPLVYLAAAKAGGYALIVAADHDPQYVDLPRFDRHSIAQLLGMFFYDGDEPDLLRRRITEGLTWLWENGLRELMFGQVGGPVATLIPVGLLGLVPLHASGGLGWTPEGIKWHHAGSYTMVRYAPNARTINRCRETANRLASSPLRLIAADMPGHEDNRLEFAPVETSEVVRMWNGGSAELWHDCSWEDFRRSAGDFGVWHLACHGTARPHSILDSVLQFTDTPVTLRELRAEFTSTARRLAVLSACESNLVGTTNPNEALGMPSALIQLGFAGVIATAWPIPDLATTYLMAYFYRLWCHHGLPPAAALSDAQEWLRLATCTELAAVLPGLAPKGGGDRRPFADPRFWAAFAYTGA